MQFPALPVQKNKVESQTEIPEANYPRFWIEENCGMVSCHAYKREALGGKKRQITHLLYRHQWFLLPWLETSQASWSFHSPWWLWARRSFVSLTEAWSRTTWHSQWQRLHQHKTKPVWKPWFSDVTWLYIHSSWPYHLFFWHKPKTLWSVGLIRTGKWKNELGGDGKTS